MDRGAAGGSSGSVRSREMMSAVVSSTSIPLGTNFLDHLKTRMQSQPALGSTATPYSPWVLESARRLLAEEGAVSFYATGLPVSCVREAFTQLFRFGTYPLVRDLMSRSLGGSEGGDAAVAAKLGAGLLGGAISGVTASPADFVRIRLQAEQGRLAADGRTMETGLRAGLPPRLTSSSAAFSLIVREGGGIGALWHGASVNALRAAVLTMGTVPVYEHTKFLAKQHLGAKDAPSLHLCAGIVAGLLGTTVAAPVDVVRTRLMTAPASATMASTVVAVWREAGPLGFLRGWWPAYMRLGPVLLLYPAFVEQVRMRLFGLPTFS